MPGVLAGATLVHLSGPLVEHGPCAAWGLVLLPRQSTPLFAICYGFLAQPRHACRPRRTIGIIIGIMVTHTLPREEKEEKPKDP